MSKIYKLTKKQEKQLVKFREECLQKGLSTDPIDKAAIEKNIEFIYSEYLGINKKPKIWYCDSPIIFNLVIHVLKKHLGFTDKEKRDNLVTNLRANLWANLGDNLRANLRANLRVNLGDNLRANLGDNLGDNLWANLWANLGDNLRANLWDNLWDNLGDNLGDNLRANLWDNLWANLWDNLRANLWDNLRANLRDTFENIYWSNLEIYWISFYLFPKKFLGIDYGENNKKLEYVAEFLTAGGFFFFYKDICFVTEKPARISKKGIQLHNETEAAIEFKCGYKIYYLNGIEVPEWVVLTPASEIDPVKALKEENVEIRREVIRKIGIENYIKKLGGVCIDKKDTYELLEVDLGLPQKAKYLKMKNPSIEGVWHVEGVPFDINKVDNALAWRNDLDNWQEPEQLT